MWEVKYTFPVKYGIHKMYPGPCGCVFNVQGIDRIGRERLTCAPLSRRAA
jgi:hypothetical protein